MNTDVLLINAITRKHIPAYLPNGLLWIAAVLRENGFSVGVYDRNVDTRDVREVLQKFRPKIIGISVLTGGVILDAIYLSKTIRDVCGNSKIVWGGLHPTLFPGYVLNEEYVDYIAMGEGEYPMLELTECLLKSKNELRDIQNIGYKDADEIKINPQRGFIDMDKLPMQAFDLVDMQNYFLFRPYARKTVCIMTSRGCPYNCSFCYNKKANERKWRGLSAQKVVDTIKFVKVKYNVDGFLFYDDNFDANPIRLKEFCKILIDNEINIRWEHCSRVNYAEKERLSLEKKAGCSLISYGLESGSERILKLINKEQTVPQIQNAIRLCKNFGISTATGSIIGYPFENEEDLKETLGLFERIRPTHIFTTIYNPYPGSDLYDYVVENKLFKEPPTLQEQGKLYSIENFDLNMSSIPKELLRKVYTKYAVRNLANEVLDYMRFRNFVGLTSVIGNTIFRAGVLEGIANRIRDIFMGFFRQLLTPKNKIKAC
ncbi:MAG: radical SAM protein [Candidatus Omnitrophota bacterium]|nr:radical SAM protein [Candidatus Omnitrophota bacterium]